MPVNTLHGPVEASTLGVTLMHEHLAVISNTTRSNWPELLDQDLVRARVVESMEAAERCGVETVVDMTTADLGRDVPFLRSVAEAISLNVVLATGLWKSPPPFFELAGPDLTARAFVDEITVGIQGTDVKAGVIKATSQHGGLSSLEEVVFRAAARAHHETGLAILTHTDPSQRCGIAQQDVLEDEGVDLTRVVIGHCSTLDVDYLERLLDRGSSVSIDKFGGGNDQIGVDEQVGVVAKLCEKGYARQIVVSHDRAAYNDGLPGYDGTDPTLSDFCSVTTRVVPALRDAGVPDADLEAITRENPRAILEPASGAA